MNLVQRGRIAKKRAKDDCFKKSEPSTPETEKPKSSPALTTSKKSKSAASTPPPKLKKAKQKMDAGPNRPKTQAVDALNLALAPKSITSTGQTVPTKGFHKFFWNVLNKLATAEFADTFPDTPLLGIYYGPATNTRDVFVIWVTKGGSNGQFNRYSDIGFINATDFPNVLNDYPDQWYIQHQVDVDTISSLLSQGGPANDPNDDAIFSRLFRALQAGNFKILIPTDGANPKTAIANAVVALFP